MHVRKTLIQFKKARGLLYPMLRSSKSTRWCQKVHIGGLLSLTLCPPRDSASRNVSFLLLLHRASHTAEEMQKKSRPGVFRTQASPSYSFPTFHPQGTWSEGACIWKCSLFLSAGFSPRGKSWSPTMSWHPSILSSAYVSDCSACVSPQSQAKFAVR